MAIFNVGVVSGAGAQLDGLPDDPIVLLAFGGAPTTITSSTIVVPHSGGREVVLGGTGFTFSGGNPIGGTVTSIQVRIAGGVNVANYVVADTGINLVALWDALDQFEAGNEGAIDELFNPYVYNFTGNVGADEFFGRSQNDSLGGAAGNDTLGGEGGNDTISGAG